MIYDFLSMLDYGSCSHLLTCMRRLEIDESIDIDNRQLKVDDLKNSSNIQI